MEDAKLEIVALLRAMVEAGASDLHIKAGSPPGFRIDGKIAPQSEYGKLTPATTRDLTYQLMDDEQRKRFEKEFDLDFSYAVRDLARFRVNALTQRNSTGMVVRQISDSIPTADQIDDMRGTKEYRIKVSGVLARRAAQTALERARAN